MTPIHVSGHYHIEPGFNELAIESDRDLDLVWTADQDADVFIRIIKAAKMRIRLYARGNVHLNVLFWNESSGKIESDETYEVRAGGYLHVAYAETNAAETDRKIYTALTGEGAVGKISTAALVSCRKNFDMEVANLARHTEGHMENYSVVLEGGKYVMNAVGTIVKGASYAQNHQSSRSLSFDKGQRSIITPILQIDENEVEASHAMSVGTIDEDQLYYMMSRGLSRSECTKIISTGYLLPIVDLIDRKELQEALRQEMEEKISTLC